MKTEQQVKSQVTTDIIKKMCELAEGFELAIGYTINCILFDGAGWNLKDILTDNKMFPLLIHRAVEAYSKSLEGTTEELLITGIDIRYFNNDPYEKNQWKFKNYKPENLTQCECALLHCLIEILNLKLNLIKSKGEI